MIEAIDVALRALLALFVAAVSIGWFVGFIGFSIYFLRLRRLTVHSYNKWTDLPLWQALIFGNAALPYHPHLIVPDGQEIRSRARIFGNIFLASFFATLFFAVLHFLSL